MKRLKIFLILLVAIPFICGCATSNAFKDQYKENKVENEWDTGEEMKEVGGAMGKDLYSVFIMPFKNIFTGNIFREYPDSSESN